MAITLTDAETGKPVMGTISFDGEVMARDVTEAKIILPGRVLVRTELTIEAFGYVTKIQPVRWKLNNSRLIEMPLQMRRGYGVEQVQAG